MKQYLLTPIIYLLLAAGIAPAAEIPEYFRACVCVSGCSAVVVSSGPKWSRIITARHCFGGKHLGDKFTVTFIDGTKSEATLLTTHHWYDLAMLAVPTRDVIGSSKLATGRPDKAHYEAVGWPARGNAQQLTYFYLTPSGQPEQRTSGEPGQYDGTPKRWAFHVHNDGNTPGASGMPIFANGQFIGCNANNNGHKVGTLSLFSTPGQIAEFIALADREKGTAAWNLGDWHEPAINLADATRAVGLGPEHSNKPLNLQRFQAPQIGNAPPPPPDFNAPEPPPSPAGVPPLRNHGETTPPAAGIPPLYSGKGKPPEGYRHPKERSSKIIATEHHDSQPAQQLSAQAHREAALEQEVQRLRSELTAELENTKNIARQPGPPGRDGQDFTPPPPQPKVEKPLTVAKSKLPPFLIFGAIVALNGVVVGCFSLLGGVLFAGRVVRFFKGLAGK